MFVGNVLEPKANNLLKLPNVIFTGQKDHSLLGQYYSLFDIGLIPYTIEPYTSGVFPTKFFEYLICNVPVISSALPDLVNFGSLEFLRIYANQDEFIKSVNYYLDNEDAKSIELKKSNKMRTFAEQNSWDNRFNIIKQELNDL
jgi:glycosyltransferase involved in cell wall biosynthesis